MPLRTKKPVQQYELKTENALATIRTIKELLRSKKFQEIETGINLKGFTIRESDKIFQAYLTSLRECLSADATLKIKDKKNNDIGAVLRVREVKRVVKSGVPQKVLDLPHYIIVLSNRAETKKSGVIEPEIYAILYRNLNDSEIDALEKVWAYLKKKETMVVFLQKLLKSEIIPEKKGRVAILTQENLSNFFVVE